MCSKSNVNDALKDVGSSASSSIAVKSISAHKVRQNRDAYFLVDVREPSEVEAKPVEGVDANVTLGHIAHDSSKLLELAGTKQIVALCSTGHRSPMVAQLLAAQNATYIQHGIVGWDNMAAITPDFLVVLGLGDSQEKLSLALAACANATEMHDTVVLVLMSDGVHWFLKHDSPKLMEANATHVESVNVGEPFKPCAAMLKKFLAKGGVILACTTCIKHRKFDFNVDMMECVNPLQMPDLVRMLGDAKGGSLQFM